MMSAEERSLRNGGRIETPTPLVDVQTGAPVFETPCSNLRKHGPHIWRTLSTGEPHVCPGVQEDNRV